MKIVKKTSLVDETKFHLCSQILEGHWRDHIPGLRSLSKLLGVSRHTLRAAVRELEREGVLISNQRDSYKISEVKATRALPAKPRPLRVAVLFAESQFVSRFNSEYLMHILSRSEGGWHDYVSVFLPSGKDKHKTGYLPALMKENRADAWIVIMGTTETLRWFAESGIPTFAWGGQIRGLPLAGTTPDFVFSIRNSVGQLLRHGHRRIVLITESWSRKPTPCEFVQAFCEELAKAGIRPGGYHLPDWKETPEGLAELLCSLFKLTPPTAIIVNLSLAARGILSWFHKMGIRVPQDVSLISMCHDPEIVWNHPGMSFAYIEADKTPLVRRACEWISHVSEGTPDSRQCFVETKFIEGGSIGPVKT